MSSKIHLSHTASHAAVQVALYFAFVDERATEGYFLPSQEIAPDASTKQYLDVDLLVSKSPTQSESQKPPNSPLKVYVMP